MSKHEPGGSSGETRHHGEIARIEQPAVQEKLGLKWVSIGHQWRSCHIELPTDNQIFPRGPLCRDRQT